MKRVALLIAMVLCVLPGCRRGLAPDSDAATADKALRTALEAWKSGKTQADLEKEQPSIIMNEDDWRVGKRLLDYKIGEGGLSGRQVRYRVHIKLQEKDEKAVERDAVYIVDTIPRIVIVRDSFASS
jgi:hypothetical protein